MAEVIIKIKGLDKLRKAISKSPQTVHVELSKAIKTSVNIIRPLMRREIPVRSGKLSRNVFAQSKGLIGVVGPDLKATPYAWFVHEGTRPHMIRPSSKKALSWKGALHPVRSVRHPGTKKNPFVDRTADRAREPVNQIFGNAINKIVATLAK